MTLLSHRDTFPRKVRNWKSPESHLPLFDGLRVIFYVRVKPAQPHSWSRLGFQAVLGSGRGSVI